LEKSPKILSLDVVAKLQNAFNSKHCNYHVKQPNTMGFDMSEKPLIIKELKTNLNIT
jgi:hypothetical protein